jgi:hypothetical protein
MNLRILLSVIAGFAAGALWGGFIATAGGATYGTPAFAVCTCLGCIVGSVACGLIADSWKSKA